LSLVVFKRSLIAVKHLVGSAAYRRDASAEFILSEAEGRLGMTIAAESSVCGNDCTQLSGLRELITEAIGLLRRGHQTKRTQGFCCEVA
jgi:hypothetical protein